MLEPILQDLKSNFSQVPPAVAFSRLLMAAILGGIVGFERERRKKPAGLRTHVLVSIAACLFIVISQELSQLDFGAGEDVETQIDPLRLIETVTAGVAFLAAGIIFTTGGEVRNITPGASMWLAGAVGLACGAGEVLLALMATALVVIILSGLRQIERLFGTHN